MREMVACLFTLVCVCLSCYPPDWNISICCRPVVSPRSIVCRVSRLSFITGFSRLSRSSIKSLICLTDMRASGVKLDSWIDLLSYDFNFWTTQFSIQLFIYFHIQTGVRPLIRKTVSQAFITFIINDTRKKKKYLQIFLYKFTVNYEGS
jgi:hypothetical protein